MVRGGERRVTGTGVVVQRPIVLLLIPLILFLLVFVSRRSYANMSRNKLIWTLALRSVAVSLVVLALAGPAVPMTTDRINLLFVVDRSMSIDDDNYMLISRYIAEAQKQLGQGDRVGLMFVDRYVSIEQPLEPNPARDITALTAGLSTNEGTALAAAADLAVGLMPSDGANRLVIFSDFNETHGSIQDSIGRLIERGIEVYAVPLYSDSNEVLVRDLNAPEYVSKMETYQVSAIVESQEETEALIRLYRDGVIISETEVNLAPGLSRYDYHDVAFEEGLVSYKIEVIAHNDRLRQNNAAESFVLVKKGVSVLFVHSATTGGDDYVTQILAESGFKVDKVPHHELRSSPFALAQYDAVFINDVSAYELGFNFMRSLKAYVEDLGGGLVVAGGPHSFGMGTYRNTLLEDVLPVTSDVRRQELSRRIALIIVLDRSGSMGSGAGVSKLEIAKEAAIEAMQMLHPEDDFGLLAFDTDYSWVVPFGKLGQSEGKERLIRSLQASGGTNLPRATAAALEIIKDSERDIRHLIVLSDGQTTGSVDDIISTAVDLDISVSTVAIGSGANTALLSEIAYQTGGVYYIADNPFDIPSIVLKDTVSVARSSVVEESFSAVPVTSSPVIDTIDWSAAPMLDGYVATTAKPFAEVLLGGKYLGDPLLAVARFGSGKSAAFTSDIGGIWSSEWASWEGASVLWRQLMRWVRSNLTDFPYGVTTHIREGRLKVVVDAVDEEGRFINNLSMRSLLLTPGGTNQEVPLVQSAPGRYEATFTLEQTGAHVLQVQLLELGVPVRGHTAFFSLTYGDEFSASTPNEDLAAILSHATGGRLYAGVDDVTRRGKYDSSQLWDVWHIAIVVALGVFVVELGLRYISFNRIFR